MARRRSVMSEDLKYELAKELGVADTVAKQGWGEVSSRNCGNLVRLPLKKRKRPLPTKW